MKLDTILSRNVGCLNKIPTPPRKAQLEWDPQIESVIQRDQGESMLIRKSWIALCAAVLTSGVFAQNRPDAPEFDVKEHYTKYEYRIPMRDGVKLFTSVYVPKDASHAYPGFFTSASMIDSHPALKAASPQAPMTNLFMGDDAYHGGAFMLAANFDFYSQFKPQENPQLPPKTFVPFDWGTKDAYEFYLNVGPLSNLKKYLETKSALWDDQVLHDTYDDYWKARNLAPHRRNIH